jgi:hypothetical protein
MESVIALGGKGETARLRLQGKFSFEIFLVFENLHRIDQLGHGHVGVNNLGCE